MDVAANALLSTPPLDAKIAPDLQPPSLRTPNGPLPLSSRRMKNLPPNEIELKAAVLNRLLALNMLRRGDLLMSELPLPGTSVRADLVCLAANGRLLGIEIKSDRDSLSRLDRQLDTYRTYFDEVIVAVGQRHLARVLDSTDAEISVWVARGGQSLENVRDCCTQRCAPKSGADLLTQRQARDARTADRSAYRDALRNRFSKTSDMFWQATTHREIEPKDLRQLSRFEGMRAEATKSQAVREAMLSSWANFFATQSVHSSSVS